MKNVLFELPVTTAIGPTCDRTMPFNVTWSMIKHFFPAPAHGAPESRVMMMLTNGSRPRFSSGAGFSAAPSFFATSFGAAAAAGIFFASFTFAAGLAAGLASALAGAVFFGALATGVAAFFGTLATGLVAGSVGFATGLAEPACAVPAEGFAGACANADPASAIIRRLWLTFITVLLLPRRLRWRRCARMTVEGGCHAARNHALVRLVTVSPSQPRACRLSYRRHRQVRDVDDSFHLPYALEEIEHRVVRTVDLDVERSL